MEYDEKIGGCCGFMGVKREREDDEHGEDNTGIIDKNMDFVSYIFHKILFSI
jgi:hypothetical protein